MIEVLILWIPLCALVGWAASQKNRSGIGFFFLSFFLTPLIGLLVLIAVPSLKQVAAPLRGNDFVLCHWCKRPRRVDAVRCPHCNVGAPDPNAGQKKCPACAEWILAEAKKCKHCGEVIAPPKPPEPRPPPAPNNWKKIDETERSLDQRRR